MSGTTAAPEPEPLCLLVARDGFDGRLWRARDAAHAARIAARHWVPLDPAAAAVMFGADCLARLADGLPGRYELWREPQRGARRAGRWHWRAEWDSCGID